MIVTRLSLTDYRNYEGADLELVPGPNLLVGSNGQGKTNLVEAIGYLSTLGSHRVSSDAALIRTGAESAIIRARLEHGDRSLLLELQLNRTGANRAQVNRGPVKPRELPRYISTVLFAPEDLALVRGEPSGRRRFLDQLLVQLTPRLSSVFADYERVVRQRNTLLKSARGARLPETGLSTLEIWNERLVDLGSEIIEARGALVGAAPPARRGRLRRDRRREPARRTRERAQHPRCPARRGSDRSGCRGAHRDQRGGGGRRVHERARPSSARRTRPRA